MAAPASDKDVVDVTGAFTPEVFERHLSGLTAAPAWWLERKRSAYARFEALPMPSRADEGWRLSNISGGALGGYAHAGPHPGPGGDGHASLAVESAASLSFLNGRRSASTPLPADLAARGVVVSTLSEALTRHPELLMEHFMAQPQKLGSAKFAALHEAFVQDGAFIHVPKGVDVGKPVIVVHAVSGPGTAVFPHTLVIADDNARVTVV